MATQFTSLRPPTTAEGVVLASGLSLAGRHLEPPLFHAVSWRPHQRFTADDDPDRTKEAWQAPAFVQRDPTLQHAKMCAQEIALPHKPLPQSFARVIHGALNEEDCAALVSAVNAKGFTPALLNIGKGRQQLEPDCRDGFRVIVDSTDVTSWLLEVLRPFLPDVMGGDRLLNLNERCRFLCYTPGQEFGEHYDGCFQHPSSGASSQVTVQLYLHDVPEENGGATTFLSDSLASEDVPCQPGAGSVLIFSQDLLHEGSLLRSGLKYTFRTEAMYKRC